MAKCHGCRCTNRVTRETVVSETMTVELCKDCFNAHWDEVRMQASKVARAKRAAERAKREYPYFPPEQHRPFEEVKEHFGRCGQTEESRDQKYTHVEWHEHVGNEEVPIAHGTFNKENGLGFIVYVGKYRYAGEAAKILRKCRTSFIDLDEVNKRIDIAAEIQAKESLGIATDDERKENLEILKEVQDLG